MIPSPLERLATLLAPCKNVIVQKRILHVDKIIRKGTIQKSSNFSVLFNPHPLSNSVTPLTTPLHKLCYTMQLTPPSLPRMKVPPHRPNQWCIFYTSRDPEHSAVFVLKVVLGPVNSAFKQG